MDWNSFEANWKHLEGWLKQKWGRLTKDNCDYISGSRDRLVGCLQEKYGLTKVEAERDAGGRTLRSNGFEFATSE